MYIFINLSPTIFNGYISTPGDGSLPPLSFPVPGTTTRFAWIIVYKAISFAFIQHGGLSFAKSGVVCPPESFLTPYHPLKRDFPWTSDYYSMPLVLRQTAKPPSLG